MNKIKTCSNKGFHITLHGITLSVQFGPGNYCDNYDEPICPADGYKDGTYLKGFHSSDAEIAVFGEDGELVSFGGEYHDTVMGRVPVLSVAKIIAYMAEAPRTTKEVTDFAVTKVAA